MGLLVRGDLVVWIKYVGIRPGDARRAIVTRNEINTNVMALIIVWFLLGRRLFHVRVDGVCLGQISVRLPHLLYVDNHMRPLELAME